MSPKEHAALQEIVEELVAKNHICPSFSLCKILALLVLKKDRSWQMCVDSKAINKITICYSFPILPIEDLFDKLHGSHVFSRFDLRNSYR